MGREVYMRVAALLMAMRWVLYVGTGWRRREQQQQL
jgi:hypothetical protein